MRYPIDPVVAMFGITCLFLIGSHSNKQELCEPQSIAPKIANSPLSVSKAKVMFYETVKPEVVRMV